MHEPTAYTPLHRRFGFTSMVKTVTFYFRLPVGSCISDEDFECIEQFVVLLCNITSPCISVNECRNVLYTKKCCPVEKILPTKAALEQHIKQAML